MIKFSELKKLENKAIRSIGSSASFAKLPSLYSAAQKAQIGSDPRVKINTHLSFTLPIKLREDHGSQPINRRINIGCLAVCSKGTDEIVQLSYSVLIGKDAEPGKYVARKFHFDFEPAQLRNIEELKPTFHMQICGKLSDHQKAEGFVEDDIKHLLPSWSQPRVPVQPTSLVLLLNWLFIEFGSHQIIKSVRRDPHWRSLVREAETEILRPYFEACAKFLCSSENVDRSFITDHLYEEH